MEERRSGGGVLDEAVVGQVMEEDDDVILPGFRFHPTDEELVGFYLRRKAEGKPLSVEIIKQADIYKYDPWDLPRVSNIGDKEWYFFCLRGRKYRNSIRPNRVTGSGFWKATGIDRPVYGGHKGDCVGLKKSLVYYRGSAGKGTKTDWMMHEFRLPPAGGGGGGGKGKVTGVAICGIQEGETWTICRIFKRAVSYKKRAQSWRSGAAAAAAEQVPTGVSSTVCSAESNGEADYKQQPESSLQRSDDNSTVTWYEDQLWSSPPAQAPSPASTGKDLPFGDDGCWDELARVVEFSADPFFVYDYTDTTYDAGSFRF